LQESVDSCTANEIIYHILRYNRLDKGTPIEQRKPIVLYIASPGGSVVDGFGLIDAILMSETPVYTVNQSMCYSMAFLIFIAGRKRYSMKHSTFLCHDGSSFAYDSMSKLKDRMEFETGQMEEKTKQYIIAQTDITDELYQEKYRKEWYMYADEAKQYGIVDYIIGDDCKLEEIL
jgi:ATP-dependent Clp protease protease subunit